MESEFLPPPLPLSLLSMNTMSFSALPTMPTPLKLGEIFDSDMDMSISFDSDIENDDDDDIADFRSFAEFTIPDEFDNDMEIGTTSVDQFKWNTREQNKKICLSVFDEMINDTDTDTAKEGEPETSSIEIEIPSVIKNLIFEFVDNSLCSIVHTTKKDIETASKVIYSETFTVDKEINLQCGVTMDNESKFIEFACGVQSIPNDINEIRIEYELCCKQAHIEYRDYFTVHSGDNEYSSLTSFIISDKIFNQKCIDAVCWSDYTLPLSKIANYDELTFGCNVNIICKQ